MTDASTDMNSTGSKSGSRDAASEPQEKADWIQSAELGLLQSESLPELLGHMFNRQVTLFQMLSINLLLIDRGSRIQHLLQETGSESKFEKYLKLHTGDDIVALIRNLGAQPILTAYEANRHQWLLTGSDQGIKGIAILPMIRHDEVIGVITCTSVDPEHFHSNFSINLLKRFAAIIAISIENMVDCHHLQYLGLTDSLTDVRNRRFLDQYLPEQVANAVDTDEPMAFLFIDIDHFKKVNDTYGHQAGDKVLVEVADLIYGQLGHTDIVARYGGEEFAALLKNKTMGSAQRIAERVRSMVENTQLMSDGKIIQITVSIGIAELTQLKDRPKDIDSLAYQLTRAADRALYMAKKNGRNQVAMIQE